MRDGDNSCAWSVEALEILVFCLVRALLLSTTAKQPNVGTLQVEVKSQLKYHYRVITLL